MSSKFTKILVAIDRSEAGLEVFEHGLALAQQNASQLMIVHSLILEVEPDITVLAGMDLGFGSGGGAFRTLQLRQESLQKDMGAIQSWLQDLCDRAKAGGVRAEFEGKVGDPGTFICQKAQAWGADLVVVGRRGRKGLSEVLLGSVSNYVLHNAPCSVLVVQGQAPV